MAREYTLSECVDGGFDAHHPSGLHYSAYTKRVVEIDHHYCVRVVFPLYFGTLPQDGWTREGSWFQ